MPNPASRLLLAVSLFAAAANSQGDDAIFFDVASVKPSVSGPLKMESDPIRLTARAQAVDVLIRLAFGLREYQYRGPAWLHTARYDIVATTAAPLTRRAQLQALRNLLIDRFKLQFHEEAKDMPVYGLVVVKGGPKLQPLDAALPAAFDLYSNFHIEPAPGNTSALRGAGSIGQLCDFLSRIAGRPVIDRTGVAGSFDIRLHCAIDGYPGEDTRPDVFDALPAQMGLKLEAQTAAIEITVIDHVQKPAAN